MRVAILVNLTNVFSFQPASTAKAGVHTHTLQHIRDGPTVHHSTLIPRHPSVIYPNGCPSNTRFRENGATVPGTGRSSRSRAWYLLSKHIADRFLGRPRIVIGTCLAAANPSPIRPPDLT